MEARIEVPDLRYMIFAIATQIPKGMVSTYGDIARALGDVRASRAVGKIMAADLDRPFPVPCHRVVYTDGRVGWYHGSGRGTEVKASMLMAEGVPVGNGQVMEFAKYRFTDFVAEPVLESLAHRQDQVASSVIETETRVEAIAGIDVAYEGDRAFGAAVVTDLSGEVFEERTVEMNVRFSYVPTYLSYRELPVMARLVQGPEVMHMVDGNGRLHPRRAGIACQLGVEMDVPSIGVAKSLLCGSLDDGNVLVDGTVLGRIVGDGRPVYVSVGHRTTLEQAERLCRGTRHVRVPEPVRRAHILAGRLRDEFRGRQDADSVA